MCGFQYNIYITLLFHNAKHNHLNQPTIIMKALPTAECNHILSLLDSGYSRYDMASQTGVSNATISGLCFRHCPYIKKSSSGCPSKLSEQDLCYAIWLIGTGKAGNAVQVTKTLQHSTNQSVSVQNGMHKVGMNAVVKTTYYQTS